MIDRYVFVKLKPEHATAAGRAEVREKSRELTAIPGVLSVAVGTPADQGAVSAWDVSLALRFDSLQSVERYLEHPGHQEYYQGFLEPRVQVIKAWNFEV